MSDPFLGEIRIFAGNYAPHNWAFCDGQVMAISANAALASLLGSYYGGDGRTTFGLPDFRGRIPVHFGQGPGLTNYPLGTRYGFEKIKLTIDQIPSHNHPMQGSTASANSSDPRGRVPAMIGSDFYATDADSDMAADIVDNYGGNDYHGNVMASLCINFIICLNGTYPSRN